MRREANASHPILAILAALQQWLAVGDSWISVQGASRGKYRFRRRGSPGVDFLVRSGLKHRWRGSHAPSTRMKLADRLPPSGKRQLGGRRWPRDEARST
jgi:hypothetical protein